ncbi:MAG: recombinase family protein [Patescibacteria group bacterium]|nr:recombinase family protein [Patescibacteria group bacterium]
MTESTPKEIKLVAVYGRVSTSNQEDQKTIEAQLLEVDAFAKDKYTIVKKYLDEGWSGDILARPALDQLRQDARKHLWQAVIIYDPDRLGRRLFYQQIVIDELKQLGIEILFVTMPPIKNESDELMFGIRGLFAQYEKAKITERFRIGKNNRVSNGNVLVSEAPYGYSYIPNKGKKGGTDYEVGHFEINEYEANNVKQIFSLVADDGLTLRAVVRKLQESNILPRKSKRGVWNTSTLSTLLRNEAYIGIAHWGKTYGVAPTNPTKNDVYRKVKKSSRRLKPIGEWKNIKVPAIITDKSIFERAGAQLKANFATLGRFKKNDYLIAGNIWCAGCGRRRTGEGPQYGKHLYYRCSNRVYSFPLPRTCLEKGINARIADEAVWQRLKLLFSSSKLMNEQVEKWLKRKKYGANDSMVDIPLIEREIAKLQAQEDRYQEAHSKDLISIEKLKGYIAPLREKIASFKNQIAKAQAEKGTQEEISLPSQEEIESFVKESTAFFENTNLNFQSKRTIVKRILEKVTSTQREMQVYGAVEIRPNSLLLYSDLDNVNIKFKTGHRHRRITKCRKKYTF